MDRPQRRSQPVDTAPPAAPDETLPTVPVVAVLQPTTRRRLGQLLLGLPLLGAALAAQPASEAEAASATTTWKLGGNNDVNTDGSNFLGSRNNAPLVFKVNNVERARINTNGRVGINTASPTNALHVVALDRTAVRGESRSASAGATGVLGDVTAATPGEQAAGVKGVITSATDGTRNNIYGVWGDAAGKGVGVFGSSDDGTDVSGGIGVFGGGGYIGVQGFGGRQGIGVYGESSNVSSMGVVGRARGSESVGVYGLADSNDFAGVWGEAEDGYGVFARSREALRAEAVGEGGIAGNFFGRVQIDGILRVNAEADVSYLVVYGDASVEGTLTKSAGGFKIDHPLDPTNKYLYHSFVESPEMKNIYDGIVTTDANGEATVTMPAWFEALNQEFRYQLTCVGQFAQAIVASEISGNQFAIKTDKPSVKISWQVTGVRHDAYAEANRIPVEQDKSGDARGTYLHPSLYGQPARSVAVRQVRPVPDLKNRLPKNKQ